MVENSTDGGGIRGALRGLFTFDIAGMRVRKWENSGTEDRGQMEKVEKVKTLPFWYIGNWNGARKKGGNSSM